MQRVTGHRILLQDDEAVCIQCGQPFKSSTKNQKYCSYECYVQDGFYRDEQMEYLISQLKKG